MKDFDLNNFLKFIENNEKKKDVVAVAVESTFSKEGKNKYRVKVSTYYPK